jgi:hypothetical protein
MKSEFRTDLYVRYVKGRLWKLITPFTYYSEIMDEVVIVTEGFQTNFASVPYKTDPRPAVIHDYLYSKENISRKLADQVFLEAMNVTKDVNKARRYLRYWAVRMFGGSHK